jgi:CRISPR-associated exonuclease Cas4
MEHTSDLVAEGKLIHENSYPQRTERYEEININGCRIDFYDTKNKIVHEIKKSDKIEKAHEWQVKYYILALERNGIYGVKGLIEYPALRHVTPVELTEADRNEIAGIEQQIASLAESEQCPPLAVTKICRNCSYYEFCYVNEEINS